MNKKETDVLSKTVEAITMVSERLDTVFKAVEAIQKHIIGKQEPSTFDTRIDMFKDNHSNDCICDTCKTKAINEICELEHFGKITMEEMMDRIDELDNNKAKLNKMADEPRPITYHKEYIPTDDINRRLDRLEEGLCAIISRRIDKDGDEYYPKSALNHFKAIVKEIYEEQAAARGDYDE